jgi:hypothetical protein
MIAQIRSRVPQWIAAGGAGATRAVNVAVP